ncbi:MAG: PAS domain-containing sensor histidine kinase [Burkholderiales bacterium RIFCSPLOWO2_12_67_14]|nr:MAG: PAS domain-containing sensor histidine kinase [Burkholderiales bacterium RIFCSPLOWO2_02_FULL_67_64]OGB39896.1 MAG: PAS domain-containing sensor histidine kinase [Burkholderiales bacterium RIFCSPLOWO2_12_67_14]OGB52550.1 MAG: PAS domain-containing sensor histidine kinase [Burkholderiales bacterium RIFCSPHIGHO2_12_FULL_67_38]OGC00317.1 MAG: PAS domain-containing sensor histidine kinase [Burkholderiales bacterium RIFCSPLOWO2_12_FULL_67_210]
MIPLPSQSPSPPPRPPSTAWWKRWWRRLPPSRQDRFATLAPLLAVLLFLSAIAVAITYLRYEELEREQEAVTRDVEYAQQRLRLRLLERQEQLMRLAREVDNKEISTEEFVFQVESLISQFPELLAISWVDTRRNVVAGYASPSAPPSLIRPTGSTLAPNETDGSFDLARDLRQPIYSRPLGEDPRTATLMLQVPLSEQGRFAGTVMGEYSIDGLMRFGMPPEIMARYAVALLDDRGRVLAGSLQTPNTVLRLLPWSNQALEHEVPVSPVGNGLILKAQGYRTSQDIVGSGFFWVIGALSALTVWMLLGTWRHTRRRVQAQQALVAETNFRRAMENSMLTGMRALDIQGRITYVNPAFCSMTGWTESELVGRTAPFPYWPDEDHDQLAARLEDELNGRSTPGGFEVRVQRRDGSIFDARMYVSPLIDPKGHQTGWMTSMTDITEPKRIREELSASYERFTTVLESLDSAVSVAPLGSDEMLFANKMYRLWFGTRGQGHRHLVDLAGTQPTPNPDDGDAVDAFAGMPTDTLTDAGSENAEVFVEELDRWLEVRTRYLTWVDGRLAQMVIASDITPRRNAEEQASRQAERAQTASRLITMGEMASSVAHELNQPLTAISNYCNGMISRVQEQRISPEELLGALEKTARQAQRAGQIIQRIRAFVKRSEPNPTPSDVALMVSNAIELADIELRRQQVRLSPYVAARLPSLMVDPILIEQVLINLLKNAGEAIAQAGRPPGERYVELRVGPRRQDDQDVVEFSVRDSGNGVPDEMIERIYEAFYSTKSEGMGIGLKLCRSIVESHHGRMQVQNIYNGEEVVGCCFSFWIPVVSRLRTDGTVDGPATQSLTDTERAR